MATTSERPGPRMYSRLARLTVELDTLLESVGWGEAFPGLRDILRKLRSRAVRMSQGK